MCSAVKLAYQLQQLLQLPLQLASTTTTTTNNKSHNEHHYGDRNTYSTSSSAIFQVGAPLLGFPNRAVQQTMTVSTSQGANVMFSAARRTTPTMTTTTGRAITFTATCTNPTMTGTNLIAATATTTTTTTTATTIAITTCYYDCGRYCESGNRRHPAPHPTPHLNHCFLPVPVVHTGFVGLVGGQGGDCLLALMPIRFRSIVTFNKLANSCRLSVRRPCWLMAAFFRSLTGQVNRH